MKTKLPIHERFYAFQGEGNHMGRSAFFIRTFGCPVHCPWCDSAGTWHKDYVPKEINRMEIADLVAEAVSHKPSFVVITGGEPTVHPQLSELANAILTAGIPVHLETCGAFEFDRDFIRWVTLSPKREKLPTAHNLCYAAEIKIIVDHPLAVSEWFATLDSIYGSRKWLDHKPVWLHPEWSQRNNPDVLNAISEAVKSSAPNEDIRAGYQLHKLYQVDALDKNTKPLAPLGGNPKLGF